MNVDELSSSLALEVKRRAYIRRLDILEQTASLLKSRLHITPHLFVQVYRNDRFDTTNFVLVHNGQRLYGRDQLGGVWHRHPADAPQSHDRTADGARPVDLREFLNEVEDLLAVLGLP